ncbi:MAG: TonB family protein [Pseudomonadales bacterium]|nr:TonB family protein [Pseudomonadales bacterium]
MEITTSENLLLTLFSIDEGVGFYLDWLLKSVLIIGSTWCLIYLLTHKLSSSSKHLLWLNSITCIGLLPIVGRIPNAPETLTSTSNSIVSFQVIPSNPYALESSISTVNQVPEYLKALYLVPVVLLTLRLLLAIANTIVVNKRATLISGSDILSRASALSSQLSITRKVTLKFSTTVSTPLSFGLFRPTIILPRNAEVWDQDTMDDVLIHELSHIKRFDWLTLLFVHLVVSIQWINPFAWVALKRITAEAENSCDSAVLRMKQQETAYAETLLTIAQEIKHAGSPPLFAQQMLGNRALRSRINRILENNMARATSHKLFSFPLLGLAVGMVVACSNTDIVNTEVSRRPPPEANPDSRGEMLPIEALAPLYPTRAAFAGIEGWALVKFDVLASGDVEENSVEVIDAEPPYTFDRAVIRAASRFKFEPVVNNSLQSVNDVQYLFRFCLNDNCNKDDEENSINRELVPTNEVAAVFPQQARNAGLERGTVWTVFHVTREGTVQDVTVNYSSDDLFTSSAITASQQLRFAPGEVRNSTEGRVQGDTTGLVRAQYLFRFE